MKKADFDRMYEMLIDVERQMLYLLESKAADAKQHLESVINNDFGHDDFVTACAICNNIEMDKRNAQKAMYTLLRTISKYKHRAE